MTVHLDSVIAELEVDAGASRLSRDKLVLAQACKDDVAALREEMQREIRRVTGELTRFDAAELGKLHGVDMRPLEQVEREHCVRVLRELDDVELAAGVLGISPPTLYRRLRSWHVPTKLSRRYESCESSSPSPSSQLSSGRRSARA